MNTPNLATRATHFDELFRFDADPWQTRTRWYEVRRRALLLASLPHERYERACEPGCGAGETSAALAQRCDVVIASDASAQAVRQARRRVTAFENVRIAQARMPRDWPEGHFDLIVVSELGYYLSSDELGRLAEACRSSLMGASTLLACHWRRPEPDMLQRAEDVHAELHRRTGLWTAFHHEDDDFLLDVWTADTRSVAQCEGLA